MTRPKVDPDKRQRTAQACDSCKRRKQKCNGLKPCMTCGKRNLTCTYGSMDDGSDDPPSPKRRMIEVAPSDYISPGKSFETPAATPTQQPSIRSPVTDGRGSSLIGALDAFTKRPDSLSINAFISSINATNGNHEEKKLLIPKHDDTIKSRGSTASQGDEEAVVYSNTRMLQDPTGRLLYIGDSATLSFLQLIRMIVDNVAGSSPFTMDPRRHKIVENMISLPENFRRTHLLPDRQTADILVNAYFTNVSGLVEVFHQMSFMTTLDLCYSDPLSVDPSWLCLLYLTLAIGLVMAAPIPGSSEEVIIKKLRSGAVNRAEVFYLDAKHLCDPSAGFEDAGFWSIQALTLMAVYTLAVSKRNAAYAYHGMAVRSAFALGLHREETYPIFSGSEQLVRRNLWRTLFILDRFLATSLGRPTSIRESDCSGAALSSEEQSSARQAPFSPPATGTFITAQSLGIEAAVRSCHVIGVILENVYSSRKISTKVAQDIADSCKGWHKALDPSLNYRHQMYTSPGQGIAILHVNLLYCHSVILLTRPFFLFVMNKAHSDRAEGRRKPVRKALTKLEKFAEACVSASSHTIALVHTARECQHLPHRNPFVLYFLFASALVIIANEFSALFPNPTANSTINNAVSVMHYFAQQDSQGSRLLFILTSFRDVTLREQASRGQNSGAEHQTSVFQQPPLLSPVHLNINDPLETVFSLNSHHEKPPPTPSSIDPVLNRTISNPSMTPPNQMSSILNHSSSFPANAYMQDHNTSHRHSIYSLDSFFDLGHPIHQPHSSTNSDCNDSMGESAEIDFESLWQWPNTNGGVGMDMGPSTDEGISGTSIGTGVNGGFGPLGVQRISDSNVPLFGISSADFGAP